MRRRSRRQLQALIREARTLQEQGRIVDAVRPAERAVEVARTTFGPESPEAAGRLNDLAGLRWMLGDLPGASVQLDESIRIRRGTLGPADANLGESLYNLGLLELGAGDLSAAERHFLEAEGILRGELGQAHPRVAMVKNALGHLRYQLSDYDGAEALYRDALAILGEGHPLAPQVLANAGDVAMHRGHADVAEDAYGKAYRLQQEAERREGPDDLGWLSRFADLARVRGDYETAERLLGDALQHARTPAVLWEMGVLHHVRGELKEAESLYREALDAWTQGPGELHPETDRYLIAIGIVCAATGRADEALERMVAAAEIHDRVIGGLLSVGSERRRLAFLERVRRSAAIHLSVVLRHRAEDPLAVGSGLDLTLRRKAVSAEASAVQREAVLGGRYPELADPLRRLSLLRMQIATKSLSGPGPEGSPEHHLLLEAWKRESESLETELASSIPEMDLERRLSAADRRAVSEALPERSALVEFVRVEEFDFDAVQARGDRLWKPARYLAFILAAGDPEEVRMVDLGDADRIDGLIAAYRETVTGRGSDRAARGTQGTHAAPSTAERRAGTTLRQAVFDPLLDGLGGRHRVFLSPDGDITRLPFEVLPAEGEGRLVHEYVFSYLSTGRDVLRFGAPAGPGAEPLVAAAPDFDLAGASPEGPPAGRRSRDLDPARIHFDPLDGTVPEGEDVGRLLRTLPWTGGAVLEARLKGTRSPRVLHLATHGFFLRDQGPGPDQEVLSRPALEEPGPLRGAGMENPLLRSGLALAGANTFLAKGVLPPDAEDGILTAEDVSGLDLLGTELVVLSACETGLGEIRVGEGVFGLRRAFVLAGARTLVMSLWKVPDEPSAQLMEAFYENLGAGMGRAEALREAQLALARLYPPPWFWGAFICQGDPGPLETPARTTEDGPS